MKPSVLFPLFVLMTPLAAQSGADPAPASAAAADKELLPNQKAFLNLPEEKRKEFIKHLGEANRVFQQQRVFDALAELDKASAIFADSPEVHNLRGSCFVEMRAFPKAIAEFTKAVSLSKENPSIIFNIGEVNFVTKQWKEALEVFEKVMKILPPENISLGRLVEFKILLCKKKLGLDDDVLILADKYDYLDDSPYYYYCKAALAYEEENLIEAEQWLARAKRIFRDPNVLAPWQDTLVEYGYIKSFYGEDEVTDE